MRVLARVSLRQAVRKSSGRMGRRWIRLPVAAKIALATAGAIAGVDASPTPPGSSVLGMTCTSTWGISFIRNIG